MHPIAALTNVGEWPGQKLIFDDERRLPATLPIYEASSSRVLVEWLEDASYNGRVAGRRL